MRKYSLLTAAAITLGVSLAAVASAQNQTTHHKKTVGYQDEHGVFHTLARPDPEVFANVTHTGKFVINYNVKIETPQPSGSTIYCSADITVDSEQSITTTSPPYETETSIYYDEEGEGSVAAGATGSTVACQVVINYSWSFPNKETTPPTDTVTNTIGGAYSVGAVKTGTTTVLTLEGTRVSSSSLPIANTIPTSGATTTVTVAVTL
jgi:hypothetical protein